MASGGAEQHSEDLHAMIDVQVGQLQTALRETMAIASTQGCGVSVIYKTGAELKVDMYVDQSLAIDEVRYASTFPDNEFSPKV